MTNYLNLIFSHQDKNFPYQKSFSKELESGNELVSNLHHYRELFTFEQCISNDDEIKEIKAIGAYLSRFDKVLVLGIGGSILNGRVFSHFIHSNKIIFCDNIDPFSFELILENLNLSKTGIIIISKSGNTPEVVMQSLCLIEYIKEHYGNKFSVDEQMVLITTRGHNFLTQFASYIEPKFVLEYKKIGGRYSIFTSVGLLIAEITGLNIDKIVTGANNVIDHFLTVPSHNNLPIKAACESLVLLQERFNIQVIMFYIEKYAIFAEWFKQIYSESLGKEGKGILPVTAKGTTDQHSQLQLYLDGPQDKYFTFISYDSRNHGIKAKMPFQSKELEYLDNATMGNLYHCEKQATMQSLKDNNAPVRELILTKLDEQELGSVLMHYMLETILVGFKMKINPFDQPSIEKSKLLAKNSLLEERVKISL
jgi:glucose-6-phosphate isomerase